MYLGLRGQDEDASVSNDGEGNIDWFSTQDNVANPVTMHTDRALSSLNTVQDASIPPAGGKSWFGDFTGSASAAVRSDELDEGQFKGYVESQQAKSVPKHADAYGSPNQRMAYSDVYEEHSEPDPNPFGVFNANGNAISTLNALRLMSEHLMQEIKLMVGDFRLVESVEITGTGLVINDITYRPRFSPEVLKTMPRAIQLKVGKGNVVDLFHFGDLKKFKNLACLRIDNSRLAEGRFRQELGFSPRKPWHLLFPRKPNPRLFERFPNLIELYIAGVKITDEATSKEYDNNGRGGFTLTEKLRKAFNMRVDKVSSPPMERVWDSKPVRFMSNTVGWSMAIKGVALAAAFMGPWAVVAAGIAGYAVYKDLKNKDGSKGKEDVRTGAQKGLRK